MFMLVIRTDPRWRSTRRTASPSRRLPSSRTPTPSFATRSSICNYLYKYSSTSSTQYHLLYSTVHSQADQILERFATEPAHHTQLRCWHDAHLLHRPVRRICAGVCLEAVALYRSCSLFTPWIRFHVSCALLSPLALQAQRKEATLPNVLYESAPRPVDHPKPLDQLHSQQPGFWFWTRQLPRNSCHRMLPISKFTSLRFFLSLCFKLSSICEMNSITEEVNNQFFYLSYCIHIRFIILIIY